MSKKTKAANDAAGLWGFDTATLRLYSARENFTYKAQGKDGQYALRLHRPGYNSETEIRSEMLLCEALLDQGVTVPTPTRSGNGNFVEAADPFLVSVLSWEPGQTLAALLAEATPLTLEKVFYRFGDAVAGMHEAADAWTVPEDFRRRHWDMDGLLSDWANWGPFWENPGLDEEEQRELRQFRQEAMQALRACAPTQDYGLIHADCMGDNVLINEQRITLIDFDDAGFGYRLFDIATSLQHHRLGPYRKWLVPAFLEGYTNRRAIDLTQMPLFAALRSVSYLGWIIPRINEPGGRVRQDRFKADALDAIRSWRDTR